MDKLARLKELLGSALTQVRQKLVVIRKFTNNLQTIGQIDQHVKLVCNILIEIQEVQRAYLTYQLPTTISKHLLQLIATNSATTTTSNTSTRSSSLSSSSLLLLLLLILSNTNNQQYHYQYRCILYCTNLNLSTNRAWCCMCCCMRVLFLAASTRLSGIRQRASIRAQIADQRCRSTGSVQTKCLGDGAEHPISSFGCRGVCSNIRVSRAGHDSCCYCPRHHKGIRSMIHNRHRLMCAQHYS
jgi:hypothetical protein